MPSAGAARRSWTTSSSGTASRFQGVACLVLRDRSATEDVLVDTLLAALDAGDRLRDPAALRSWLLRIAANKALDVRRASSRVVQLHVVPDRAGPRPREMTGSPCSARSTGSRPACAPRSCCAARRPACARGRRRARDEREHRQDSAARGAHSDARDSPARLTSPGGSPWLTRSIRPSRRASVWRSMPRSTPCSSWQVLTQLISARRRRRGRRLALPSLVAAAAAVALAAVTVWPRPSVDKRTGTQPSIPAGAAMVTLDELVAMLPGDVTTQLASGERPGGGTAGRVESVDIGAVAAGSPVAYALSCLGEAVTLTFDTGDDSPDSMSLACGNGVATGSLNWESGPARVSVAAAGDTPWRIALASGPGPARGLAEYLELRFIAQHARTSVESRWRAGKHPIHWHPARSKRPASGRRRDRGGRPRPRLHRRRHQDPGDGRRQGARGLTRARGARCARHPSRHTGARPVGAHPCRRTVGGVVASVAVGPLPSESASP